MGEPLKFPGASIEGFYSRLVLERALGDDVWFLAQSLRYYSPGIKRKLVVPAGFVTDFASTPAVVWRWFPKNGDYDGAAVIHDWGYRGNLPRWVADHVFHEAMGYLGVNPVKAFVMFLAVRMFGGRAYAAGLLKGQS